MYNITYYYDEVRNWKLDGYTVSTALGSNARGTLKAVCISDSVSNFTDGSKNIRGSVFIGKRSSSLLVFLNFLDLE
jgi:hypothetical protein